MPESLIFLTENSPGVSNDRFGFISNPYFDTPSLKIFEGIFELVKSLTKFGYKIARELKNIFTFCDDSCLLSKLYRIEMPHE